MILLLDSFALVVAVAAVAAAAFDDADVVDVAVLLSVAAEEGTFEVARGVPTSTMGTRRIPDCTDCNVLSGLNVARCSSSCLARAWYAAKQNQ